MPREPNSHERAIKRAVADVEYATRMVHKPTVTPSTATAPPGLGAQATASGTLMYLAFTLNTDSAFRVFKIPTDYVGDASVHIHWTKSGDLDESTKTARWRISYTVFDGRTENGFTTPIVVEVEDTYDDSGTTNRVVHRTSDVTLTDFTAGHYVSLKVEAITPAGTALASEPGLVSMDLLFRSTINLGTPS